MGFPKQGEWHKAVPLTTAGYEALTEGDIIRHVHSYERLVVVGNFGSHIVAVTVRHIPVNHDGLKSEWFLSDPNE